MAVRPWPRCWGCLRSWWSSVGARSNAASRKSRSWTGYSLERLPASHSALRRQQQQQQLGRRQQKQQQQQQHSQFWICQQRPGDLRHTRVGRPSSSRCGSSLLTGQRC